MLPGLDGCFVQHPPDRAATDLLTEGRLGSRYQVGERLATEWQFGLRDDLTSHRLDQGLIQRGKKRPFGRVPHDLPLRNHRQPSDFASVGLAERTSLLGQLPFRSRERADREAEGRGESVGQFGQARFGGGSWREPLARTRRKKYKYGDLVLASRLPFLLGFSKEFTSF